MANFLGSLGNLLKDPQTLASLGLTAASGGSLAPLLLRGGLAAGTNFLQQGRVDKLNKRQSKAQALANLQSAISPRGQQFQASAVAPPKPGFLERLGGAAQTGIGVHDAFKTAQQGFQARQDALGDAETARQTGRGILEAGAQGGSPQVPAAQIGGGPGQVSGKIPFNADPVTTAAPDSTQALAFQSELNRINRDQAQQQFSNQATTTRLGQGDRGLDQGDRRLDQGDTRLGIQQGGLELQRQERQDALSTNATKRGMELEGSFRNAIGPSLAADPGQTFQVYMANADSMGMDLNRAKQIFDEEVSALDTQLADKSTAFLYDKMRPRIKDDKLVSNAGNLRFAMSTIASGYNQDNGFGDVNMMIGTVRLSDPAVSVRAEDVHTLEEALAWLEQVDPELVSKMATEGDRLLPAARNRLMESALDLYDTNRLGMDTTLGQLVTEAQTALPGARPNRINTFMDTFKLPDAQSFILKPESPFAAFMAQKEIARRKGL